MERPPRRIQYTVYDDFTLTKKEIAVFHTIVKETILKNRRCAQLSLSDLGEMTGIKKNTVDYHPVVNQRKWDTFKPNTLV